jgi:hypothetical protein
MNPEAFVEEMFKVDPSIRYIAIVDKEYYVLVSTQREGVPSFATDETVRNFVSIIPQIIIDSVRKLSQFLGEVSGVTAHYQKALVIFYPFDKVIVVISFQAGVETPFYDRIAEAVKKLSAQHLT